jgi:hypothetical protein
MKPCARKLCSSAGLSCWRLPLAFARGGRDLATRPRVPIPGMPKPRPNLPVRRTAHEGALTPAKDGEERAGIASRCWRAIWRRRGSG